VVVVVMRMRMRIAVVMMWLFVQGPAGTELYAERVMAALARDLGVALLPLDPFLPTALQASWIMMVMIMTMIMKVLW
jgi:hypothetical protein